MTDASRDPRDEIDQRAGMQAPPAPRQEVIGAATALSEQTLSVDLAGAEIDRLIATAHRFPRDLDKVEAKMRAAVLTSEARAENAVYALPRAGKAIVGASIGFATALADAFGNCWDDAYLLHIDRHEKVVIARGVFMNWENNRRTTVGEPRRIVGRDGRIYNDDMIMVTSKAAQSIAVRNAILRGVPRTLWFPIYEAALFMVRGSEQTLIDRRQKAIAALANFGVDPKQVFMYLDVKNIVEVGIEHMPTLRGMFLQLRDGIITVEEMFDPRRMTGMGFEQVKNPLADEDENDDGEEAEAHPPGAETAGRPANVVSRETPQGASGPGKAAEAPGPAEAQGQGAEGASEPAPTGGRKGKTKTKEPEPAPKPEPEKAAAKAPKNAAEYVAHAGAYIAAATSASDLENKWKGERGLRTSCSITSEDFDGLKLAYEAKVGELRGAK